MLLTLLAMKMLTIKMTMMTMTTRPVPSWIRAKIASHKSLASSTPFLPEHIVEEDDDDCGDEEDYDNSVARPVKEVLGHLEILQLDCWPVTNEHPEHLVDKVIVIIHTIIISSSMKFITIIMNTSQPTLPPHCFL